MGRDPGLGGGGSGGGERRGLRPPQQEARRLCALGTSCAAPFSLRRQALIPFSEIPWGDGPWTPRRSPNLAPGQFLPRRFSREPPDRETEPGKAPA
ncbi:Gamma-Tubulin Complex Component 4 [Manis pentadactyla]|nr:Gamma-Tubulin Complex Component 4 [Manis pentadactyla]